MQENSTGSNGSETKLVSKAQILDVLFEENSKPSLRWLNYQIAARRIPFVKLGARVWFNPPQVKAALEKRTVKAAA